LNVDFFTLPHPIHCESPNHDVWFDIKFSMHMWRKKRKEKTLIVRPTILCGKRENVMWLRCGTTHTPTHSVTLSLKRAKAWLMEGFRDLDFIAEATKRDTCREIQDSIPWKGKGIETRPLWEPREVLARGGTVLYCTVLYCTWTNLHRISETVKRDV
jgi:hypothetical protein